MRVLLDDRECPFDADSIGAALAHGVDLAEHAGRRVVDVHVDGNTWGDTELNDPAKLASSATEVRLTSVEPGVLLRDTFVNAAQALADAEKLQRNAAKHLQADEAKEGMDALQEALQVWMDVQRAVVDGLEFGKIDAATIQTAEGSFTEATEELNARFSSLRDAMRAGDTVAICDCLLYEFPTTIRRWTGVLAELARIAAARTA